MAGIQRKTFTPGECLAWAGVFFALLILGAHFFRAGNHALVLCLAGVVLLHAGSAPWKAYVVGTVLAWGVMEWGAGVHSLMTLRMHMNAPWVRGALILSLVAAGTALAAGHTLAKAGRKSRETPDAPARTQAAAFLLTFPALCALYSGRPDIFLLERLLPAWGGIQIAGLAWYAAFMAGKLSSPRTSRKARKAAWILFLCVFFAQLILGLAGVPGFRTLETPHLPIPGGIIFAPIYRGSISMMPFLTLAATILAGSAWCSMLCYFGPAEALACSGRPVKKAPPSLAFALRHGRLIVLVFGSAAALGLRVLSFPPETAVGLAAGFVVASLCAMLVLSWKYGGMVHCTALCPLGLAVNLLGRLSFWRIRVDGERCDNCGACERVCQYRAVDAPSRNRGGTNIRCSLCRDCIGACPKHAIALRNTILPKTLGESVFIILIVSLHVLFIAAARPI